MTRLWSNTLRRPIRTLLQVGTVAAVIFCTGCEPAHKPPPPSLYFSGLPVSGSIHDAKKAGFTDCVNLDAVHIRCRRHGVVVGTAGRFDAAVDLDGSNGAGGFGQLTLWDDRDNDAVFKIADSLERTGWTKCLTGDGRVGDQAVYTRNDSPVRVSMDISYWSKRRLRFIPASNRRDYGCAEPAAHSVGRNSGTDK